MKRSRQQHNDFPIRLNLIVFLLNFENLDTTFTLTFSSSEPIISLTKLQEFVGVGVGVGLLGKGQVLSCLGGVN